jgi:osmoprotectant transport system ATP-binding protein
MQRDIYRVRIDSKLQDSVRTILVTNPINVSSSLSTTGTFLTFLFNIVRTEFVYDSIWGETDEDDDATQDAIVEPDNVGADK